MVNGKKLFVSASPHIRSKDTTRGIMLDVIISLIPAFIASVIIFGYRSILVTGVSIISCVLSEYLIRKFVLKRHSTIGDLSAVVTGLILALNLPSGIEIWMVIVAAVFAIVIVKQCFGGIGQNFVNPAIAARIFLLLSFGKMMEWTEPLAGFTKCEALTGATPLVSDELPTLTEMFLGIRGGSMGETCILALIIGGIYLVARRVISPAIPLSFILTVGVLSFIREGFDVTGALYQIMSGGLFLGAIFMATDYTTSPIRTSGKIIYGIGCGLVTCLIRFYGNLPEGVSYSIILMNVLTPLIEKATTPKPFGTPKKEKKAKEGAK